VYEVGCEKEYEEGRRMGQSREGQQVRERSEAAEREGARKPQGI
jgi:hypothetical protein